MIAVAQVLFAVNMVQTLRGAERREHDRVLVALDGAIVTIAVLLAVGAGVVGFFVGRAAGAAAP